MTPDELRFNAAVVQARQLAQVPEAAVDAVRAAYRRAFAFLPASLGAHPELAEFLRSHGQPGEAAALLQPLFEQGLLGFDGVFTLGNCHSALRDLPRALDCYRRAVELDSTHAMARNNLGHVLIELKQYDEALVQLSEALILDPGLALAPANIVELLARQSRWQEALPFCRACCEAEPSAHSRFMLGRALQGSGALAAARDCWIDCLEQYPDYVPVRAFLAGLLYNSGDIEAATATFKWAMENDPSNPVAVSNYLLMLNYAPLDPDLVYREHCERTRAWAADQVPALPRKRPSASGRKLRIGYVSPDFYHHPVGQLVAPTLIQHDQDQFEFYAYSTSSTTDDLTRQLGAYFGQRWRELPGVSDEDLGGRIHADGIDIAVDLTGHAGDNRLPAFARRVAPVQISYLGYPNTTGLSAMDYRITDAIADPPGLADRIHTETLLRMPAPFLCLQQPAELPEVAPAPCLRNGFLTFGSFNNLAKLSEATLKLWAQILRELPSARLVIKAAPLMDPVLKQEQQQRFGDAGIDLSRLRLHARMGFRQHLALYQQIDLALDPFPYNGTATTIEGLWMGVPLITLSGSVHAARVGSSLMSSIGLEKLVAASPEEYVGLCRHYAARPSELQQIRQSLRDRLRSKPASSPAACARKLEELYRSVGQPPAPDHHS